MCVYIGVCPSHLINDASRWTRDLWTKGVLLILGFRKTELFLKLCNDFLCFKKKLGFGVFAKHPTVYSGSYQGEGLWLFE